MRRRALYKAHKTVRGELRRRGGDKKMKKTKKSYIVRLDAISQDSADFYESTSCGCYVYDFTDVDAESLFKASKGYTLEQCKKFAGKKLILAYSAIQARRVYVLPEFFPEEVLRGTFNYDAIRQYNEPTGANYIINSRRSYPFFCTACGKQLSEADGKTHNCLASDICRVCGAKLTTDGRSEKGSRRLFLSKNLQGRERLRPVKKFLLVLLIELLKIAIVLRCFIDTPF